MPAPRNPADDPSASPPAQVGEPDPETKRLEALLAYGVLDTPPEEAFDDLARLAATICRTPIALINFVDDRRTWSKANLGLLAAQTARPESFCSHVVATGEPLVVQDAAEDQRFANLPMVVSDPLISFYAGAPITSPEGFVVGTLCVMDRTERGLSSDQVAALSTLARQAITQLELRRTASESRRVAEQHAATAEALSEAETRFRSLVETIPAVVYLDAYNEASSAIYISPQVESLLGYTPDEWVAEPDRWRQILHPDDREQALADQDLVLRTEAPWKLEYRMLAKDGSVVWVHDEAVIIRDEAGRPLYWQGIWLDMTEQKHAVEQLKEAETKYRALIEQLPAITYLDPIDEDQDSIYISPQVETIIGGTVEEWLSSPNYWASRVYPDDLDRVWDTYVEHRRTGEAMAQEYRMVRDDGRIVWIREEAQILRNDDGEPWLIQGLLYDITARRQSEEELAEALSRERKAVEHLQQLDEVKNTLLHAVSHDLRSPITSMLGSAMTLEREEAMLSPRDRQSLVRGLASSARKMHRIVNDLLDMDRLERGIVAPRRHRTDVGDLVRRVVEELGFTTDRPIEIDAEPVVVNVDAAKVERIVENLLANTARHTPSGTQVWVRVRPKDDGVRISVEDSGPGVPPDLWDTIFEPFKQGGRDAVQSPGVGIGLSLVARFAELHGGRAWVNERTGGGAAFHVYLPTGPADPSVEMPPMILDEPPVRPGQ